MNHLRDVPMAFGVLDDHLLTIGDPGLQGKRQKILETRNSSYLMTPLLCWEKVDGGIHTFSKKILRSPTDYKILAL